MRSMKSVSGFRHEIGGLRVPKLFREQESDLSRVKSQAFGFDIRLGTEREMMN